MEDIVANLLECANLDWVNGSFAAATMREAANEIVKLRAEIKTLEMNLRHPD